MPPYSRRRAARGHNDLLRLGAIALMALGGRAAYVLLSTQHQELPVGTASSGLVRSFDEIYYVNGAKALAAGDGFRYPFFVEPEERAEHPPLTSLALTPAAVVSEGLLPMRLTVAFAGSLVVLLIGLSARAVAGHRAGVIAALLAAVYPNLWMNDGLLMSETFAALGVAAVVALAYALLRRPALPLAIALGAGCAVAMLSRSELALLVPAIALPAALRAGARWRERSILAAAVAATAGLMVAPWVVYNLSRFEEPVFLSIADGDALIGANCDEAYSGRLLGSHVGTCNGGDLLGEELSVRSAIRRDLALEYAADNADRLPVVVAARIGRMWNLYQPFQDIRRTETEGRPGWAALSGLVMYWALLPLAALGGVALRRRRVPLAPLIGLLGLATLHAAMFFGFVRHRVGAEVALVVLASVGVLQLLFRRELHGSDHDVDGGPVSLLFEGAPDPDSRPGLPVGDESRLDPLSQRQRGRCPP